MSMLPYCENPLYDLLCSVCKEEVARTLIDELMDDYGSLERVLSAPKEALYSSISGTPEFKTKIIFFIDTAKALARRRRIADFVIGKCYNEGEIVKFLIGLFLFDPNENVYMLSFDKGHRLLGVDEISSGTVNTSHITTRRALEIAIRHNASYVIISHNHPLGTATPSGDDVSTTHMLTQAFRTVNIELREHYIIAGTSFLKLNEL